MGLMTSGTADWITCLSPEEIVNVLVLDTEAYSNTGGQLSKATARGAVAKFAAGAKPECKKDLAIMAVMYGQCVRGASPDGRQRHATVKAFNEAEAWEGPSLIIAYSHCIALAYDLKPGLDYQKLAVQSGYWPLFRYNPYVAATRKNQFQLDSKAPNISLEKYSYNETRYTMLEHLRKAKPAVHVPVIASLDGVSFGGWLR